MSFTVVIVAEDPTNNGYILKPLVAALLAECGKPRARVNVLTNPRTTGYEHAKNLIRSELLERYTFVDLLLFLPDADGKDRTAEFESLEAEAANKGTSLICCAAHQEVETWLLAGYPDRLHLQWVSVREEVSVKENIFASFLRTHGDARKPGGGREDLMRAAISNLNALKARCPELVTLQNRICALAASQGPETTTA